MRLDDVRAFVLKTLPDRWEFELIVRHDETSMSVYGYKTDIQYSVNAPGCINREEIVKLINLARLEEGLLEVS